MMISLPCPHHGISTKATDVAVAELAQKLRLENAFKRDIRSIFRRMGAAYRTSVATTGGLPRRERFLAQWEAALDVQYERVQRSFRGEVGRQNGGKALVFWTGKQTAETNETIRRAFEEWRDTMAPSQAAEIMDTSERDMIRAQQEAREFLAQEGEAQTDRNIAAAASAILATKFAGRVNTIAQTETQSAGEASKQIEAEAIAGVTPFVLQGLVADTPVFEDEPRREVTKTWDTVGDSRVRPSHRAVNGTTLRVSEAFVLEGSRMRFPGDLLFGAPIGLWINCRCSARYEG